MQVRHSSNTSMLRATETWIFDLDNTLYHPSARLFDQINSRMTAFIMGKLDVHKAEADRLRRKWWKTHGTTLAGFIAEYDINPAEFLAHAHDIDLSGLRPDPILREAIAALPGRKIIHTNGARAHAERVLLARGLADIFDTCFGIEDKALISKPRASAYERVVALAEIDPLRATMIEDDADNLLVPRTLGMKTVWLCHIDGVRKPPHVDFRIRDLTVFLSGL